MRKVDEYLTELERLDAALLRAGTKVLRYGSAADFDAVDRRLRQLAYTLAWLRESVGEREQEQDDAAVVRALIRGL